MKRDLFSIPLIMITPILAFFIMLAGCTNEAEKPSDSQPKQVSQNEENKGNQSGENKGTSENSNNKNQTPESEEKDVFVLNVDGVKKEIKTMDISREFELGTEIVFKGPYDIVEKTRYAENPNADIEKHFGSGLGDFSLTIEESGATYGELMIQAYAQGNLPGIDVYNPNFQMVDISNIPGLKDKFVSLMYFVETKDNNGKVPVARHYVFHAMTMEPKEMHLILHFSIPEEDFTKEKETLIYEIAKTLQIKKWGTW
ncbi:MAG: hypothetical protein BAA03_02055 [Caldibacillus debilis]|nr:MAG: hypothetical protein BAA03_02055 [Caldibacillus debilis]